MSNTLPTDELIRRLAIDSPKLVQELYTISQRQIEAETARQSRLDAKAVSLLTASGISLTVASSLAAVLLPKLAGSHPVLAGLIAFLLAFTAICGFLTVLFAVLTLRVKEYLTPSEQTIFDEAALKKANDPPGLTDVRPEDEEEKARYGLMEYQKFMIPHLWKIVQRQRTNHDQKVVQANRGQYAFLAFLILLLLACLCVVIVVVC